MQRFCEEDAPRPLRIFLIVFTQTGATLRVAEAMAEAAGDAGHECIILPTPLFAPAEVDVEGADLIAVGTPSLYCRIPDHVKRYVSHLPDLRGLPALAFVTSFGAPGRALAELGGALEQQGAEVIGGDVFRGEMRARVPGLRGLAGGRPSAGDVRAAARLVRVAATHLAEGKDRPLPTALPDGRLLSREEVHGAGHGLYDLAGLLLRDPVVRRLMPRPEVASSACTRCRWCVENCPVHAITFAERYRRQLRTRGNGELTDVPRVEPGCIRCYRCLGCPQRAIGADWGGRDRVVRLLYHPLFMRVWGDTGPRGRA